MREFDTGATRDDDSRKLDFEGFLSPTVLQAFGVYMNGHRWQGGQLRDSDNWQKGIPLDAYMKSLLRHVLDLWLIHRNGEPIMRPDGELVGLQEALGGVMFNVQGYWHEHLKLLKAEEELLKADEEEPF